MSNVRKFNKYAIKCNDCGCRTDIEPAYQSYERKYV